MAEPIIDVFVSHAYNQVEIATDLKQKLQSDTFRVFLAHDDIDGGEEWMKMLYEKVQECDVFAVLLSEEYHKANYTDQETGIAYAMNKPMIPIAIDNTTPYGFMSKYQATKSITPFSGEKISEIANLIYAHTSQGQEIINGLVHQFSNTTSFANANVVAKLLFSFKKFTKDQINNIAKAVIQNEQIRGGWDAYPLASDMLKQNFKKIEPGIQDGLKGYF